MRPLELQKRDNLALTLQISQKYMQKMHAKRFLKCEYKIIFNKSRKYMA